jgi:predicted metal-binding protein
MNQPDSNRLLNEPITNFSMNNSIKVLQNLFSDFKILSVDPHSLIFEERVHLNCFYCDKYGVNWKCPPKIPPFNYQKIITEYKNACFVYKKFEITAEAYPFIRIESTNSLHKTLLEMEQILFSESDGLCLSFIGGSCKLCKNGCGIERCNNPYLARIPLEATGVNIVVSAKKYDIHIEFPVKTHLIRLGLILW